MQKSFIRSLLIAALTALSVMFPTAGFAQGVVSSGISGTLLDAAGQPIAGSKVTVVHNPTNTTYTAVTSSSGRFRVSGLRPGGPYTVSADGGTYTVTPVENVQTDLGDDTDVLLVGRSETLQLEKMSVTGAQNDLDASATGAGSVLDARAIANRPTSTRSFADMIKSNPFVSIRAFPQITALGMNNRYNSITLDGARLNDQFGLASSGLFSLKNPFSLDAVENFSVELTPYDVTQSNFAGASINVVSKSGTNEFHGSTYYIYTSYKWQGKDLSGTNVGKRPTPFYERTWGATLGGPIIKNRLFFFLNYEKFSNPSGGPTNAGFTPDSAALSNIDAQLAALPTAPKLGKFGGNVPALLEDEKKLAKVDWNITKDHRLTVRWSTTEGNQPFYPNYRSTSVSTPFPSLSPTPSTVNGVTSYDSNYYTLAVEEKVWASQLFSNWTPDFKTEFAFSKNDTTSLRSTPVNFPTIALLNVPGLSVTNTPISTNNALLIGTDVSSMGNGIISNEIAYSGNAEYIWKQFTFKTGFDHEETDFNNLFRSGSYGVFVYNYSPTLSLANDKPLGFIRGVASTGYPPTDVSRLEQTGYFVQAKWEPNYRFNVTLGLRFDEIGSPIAPPFNPNFSTAFNGFYNGIRNDGTIDGTSRFAPRLSFNYAVNRERTLQVRGGVGVFLGRNPWVWISNSYGNAGFGRFNYQPAAAAAPTLTQYLNGSYSPADPVFAFDPANPYGTTNLPAAASSSIAVNLIEPGLKLPTNLRGNLALDYKLPKLDAVLTVEWIHTDVMEALFYENLNLKVLGGDSLNRPTTASYGLDGRLRFQGAANRLVTGYGDVLRLKNVKAGTSDYVAIGLDRPFKNGWAYNVTYTRGRATEAQPAGSSTAGSQWNFNIVFNQGAVETTRSDYEIKDRIQASIQKEFNYFKKLKTTAGLYYEGRSGQPFSYVYSGDLNLDTRTANDAFAVPKDASDPRFNFSSMDQATQTAYFAFIKSSGLDKYAGGYAPRNAFLGPWQNRLDLHLSQEVKVVGSARFEVFADFINFGSWVSKDLFNYVESLSASTANSNQARVLGNATYGADGRLIPTATVVNGEISFPAATSVFLPNATDARWRIMAGARLKF